MLYLCYINVIVILIIIINQVVVSVTDLMGGPIAGIDVVADSLAKKGDSAPILSKVGWLSLLWSSSWQ